MEQALDSSSEWDTEMVDLSQLTLDQLVLRHDELDWLVQGLLKQVERPRYNLGTGPPGRAD
ncbi:hypothetical protein Val02_53750 [Virgisporangium aliadipatigenens]|uniref:Uncharacterized protein n=1 Tax=Virgisporangium aliadipatigenens TaxID=741659 RepID=A0A8J4DSA2_9ACTN|nr:hypothetical protein [Virgisporangium aliadipatigenens]GIJ48489.1 hypothetical protein Val02_53750 [Virgisporangium aliadipatigenens]